MVFLPSHHHRVTSEKVMEYTGSCPHPTTGVRGLGYSPMMWNGNIPQVSKETFSSHTPHRQLPP